MLIKIEDGFIIDSSLISSAVRCGHYTDVRFKNGNFKQVWDEKLILWNQVEKAVKENE